MALPGQGRGGRGAAILALLQQNQRRPGASSDHVGLRGSTLKSEPAGILNVSAGHTAVTNEVSNGAAGGGLSSGIVAKLTTGCAEGKPGLSAANQSLSLTPPKEPEQASSSPPQLAKPATGVVCVPISITPTPAVAKGRAALLARLLNPSATTKIGVTLPVEPSKPVVTPAAPSPVAIDPVGGLAPKIEKLTLVAKAPESSPPRVLEKEEPKLEIRKEEAGRQVNLMANYIRLSVAPGRGVFEYDVRFSPPVDFMQLRRQFLKQYDSVIGTVRTFDGVTLYLPNILEQAVTELDCAHPVDGSLVKMTISFRCPKRLSECVHMYNVLFKRIQETLEMAQIGRNYYFPKLAHAIPEHRLEVWPGYVTSVEEQEGGLLLCCDVSHRVLRTLSVFDILIQKKNESQRRQLNFKETALKELMGLVVITKYNNRNYRIDDIMWDVTPKSTFENSSGEQISYMAYYKQQYNIDIQDENQPMLLNRLKKKRKGEEDITVLVSLVPELCFITGLSDELRSNYKIMKDLSFHTKVNPVVRRQSLVKYLKLVSDTPKACAKLEEWGLSLATDVLSMKGRVMEEEKIYFGENRVQTAGPECDWSRAAGKFPVLTPVDIHVWMFVCIERDRSVADRAIEHLIGVGRTLGIGMQKPQVITLTNDRTDTYIAALRKVTRETQLVVILFPSSRDDRYSAVKIQLNCLTPCPSQVINTRTISKPDKVRSIMQKIALQINCKLGGELWSVRIPLASFMVCGIDVYHDPTRKRSSVAGFVASLNQDCTRWHSGTSIQKPGHELMSSLTFCFTRALAEFHKVNGKYPGTIVIYRDGVGDGQLSMVRDHEVQQLMAAFMSVGPDYNPKFTEIVVQKRINTRIFGELHSGGIKNPDPGTVVDHTIVRKNWLDFFLVSQHVREGTVSPTHYVVVKDGGMKVDHLQRLTYKMTHMYFNWPGTVRVPAPCLYAHKLAYMVGEHLRKEPSELLSDRLFYL